MTIVAAWVITVPAAAIMAYSPLAFVDAATGRVSGAVAVTEARSIGWAVSASVTVPSRYPTGPKQLGKTKEPTRVCQEAVLMLP